MVTLTGAGRCETAHRQHPDSTALLFRRNWERGAMFPSEVSQSGKGVRSRKIDTEIRRRALKGVWGEDHPCPRPHMLLPLPPFSTLFIVFPSTLAVLSGGCRGSDV